MQRKEVGTVIDRRSAAYLTLEHSIQEAVQRIERLKSTYKPGICNERYYTGRQLMDVLHISPRTLQDYRDKSLIPFTTIGGTILYPESQVEEVLLRNYYKPPC